MRMFKSKMIWPALASSFLLVFPVLLQNNALAHGPPPNWCSNYYGDDVEYPATITSFIVDNSEQAYDVLADPNATIPIIREKGYHIDFVMHTDPYGVRIENYTSGNYTVVQANSSDIDGYIWQRDVQAGYPFSKCWGPVKGDQDFEVSGNVPISSMFQGDGPHYLFFETTLDDSRPRAEFYIQFVNDTAEPDPPVLPDDEQPLLPVTNDDSENDDYEFEEDDEEPPKGNSEGTLISPFIFKNETTSASASEPDEEQPLEIVDVLYINGTLASYHFLNGMQLYVLAGNWSMAMNDTAVFDFSANFTMVRTDGLDRQTYSLDNLTAVNDSDIILVNGTMTLTSALDYHANGTTTRVNATITIAKLNALKIELDGVGHPSTPIYGVVDKVMRTENGETLVMARQFDMI